MAKFIQTDRHVAFANAVAAGEHDYKAYIDHYSQAKTITKATALVNASKLMARPEMKALVKKATEAREKAIIKANTDNLPEELKGTILTVEEIDLFHYNVIRGKVLVEEVVPVQTVTKDAKGREVSRTTSFMRVKRSPNIRERQASVDAIYKRFGHYAPTKGLFGFGKVGNDDEVENVERFVLLSNGEKVKML